MAITVTKICDIAEKVTEKVSVVAVTFDSSYPTGGEAVTVPGMEFVKSLVGSFAGRPTWWDQANQKLKVYQDNGTATNGALPEVANATDLSAATGYFIAVGY